MIFNFETKSFDLTEYEQGVMLRLVHDTPFTTGQVIKSLAEIYTANFEEDVKEILYDLEIMEDEFDRADHEIKRRKEENL